MSTTEKKNSYFVLMERGFDYNDENYFPTEGGNPSKVFTSEASAKKAAAEKNASKFLSIIKNGEIREYGYCLEDVLDKKIATSKQLSEKGGIFMKLFGKTASEWWNDYDFVGFKNSPTNDELLKLVECFNFDFYEVVEVQKG